MTKKIEHGHKSEHAHRAARAAAPAQAAKAAVKSAASGIELTVPEIPQHIVARLRPKEGDPLSASASPEHLWQTGHHKKDLRAEFASMSRAEREECLKDAKEKCRHIEGQIADRAGKLEKRFDRMRYKTRIRLINEYIAGGKLPAEAAQKLSAMVQQAEAAQAKIDSVQEQVKAGNPPGGRTEAARTLRALRREQKELLVEADKLLEKHGLKIEMLAHAEDSIEPPPSPEESLTSMLSQWFHFNSVVVSFERWMVDFNDRQANDAKKRQLDDRIVADQVKRDYDKRQQLTELEKRIHAKAG
ncbi:MAG: hypothetical protein HYZ28_12505 [Myxococcales bacterium]|nr:hypothetical protein [Myxococcales bacterium]